MDKATAQALQKLDPLEADLRRCQSFLTHIAKAQVPVYFGVPTKAKDGFQALYSALHEMKSLLQNHPQGIEG